MRSTAALMERTDNGIRFGTPINTEGLLAGVHRPCPQHRRDADCVAQTAEGRLIFWCQAGEHHFTADEG